VHSRFIHVAGTAALAVLPLSAWSAVAGREPVRSIVYPAPAAPATAPASHAPVSDNVLVISIDGLRPDAIARYGAHVLERLVREGASADDARTVYPSRTLPSHTSMLTGVPPDVHGITWNDDRTDTHGTVAVPTVFGLAKEAGFTTAAFFSKSKLRHLLKPGTLDYAAAPTGNTHLLATETVEAATRYMKSRRPNVVFVHIGEPDYAGHSTGWMSAPYGWAVRRADGAVGQLVAAAERAYGAGRYSVIVTADHGGHGRTHGTADDDDMQIPWIAWGAGVEQGAVAAPVKTMDTAATVLWLLGIERPADWTGRAVATAYTEAARHAAAAVRQE
jgi:predicted AlkP superfamily pyrophosphatase or phosphodiesterase